MNQTVLDAIMAIMGTAFDPHWREAWTRAQVANSLVMPHTHALLVDAGGQDPLDPAGAVGFLLSRAAPGEEELLLIAVVPEDRGRGLGECLLERFMAAARARGAERVFLEMRSNNSAEALYRRTGFEPIGQRRAYYRTLEGEPIDAITFGRAL